MKTAILLGASGLTGNHVLTNLLNDSRYSGVKVFVRKTLNVQHPKLQEILCDLLELEAQESNFTADEVYCCIGTTKKKTPDQKEYHKIDFGIPVSAAKLCSKNNISTMVVISSMGANAKSSIFYSRTKGEMEQAVLAEKIPNTYIVRPSFIGGNRSEKRTGEKVGITLFKFLAPVLIGPLKKYRLIESKTIAKAMVALANNGYSKSILESDAVQEIGER